MHVTLPLEAFNTVYLPQLDNMARIQIVYGGSSSGKSAFKAQQVVIDLMRGARNYLVCRQVGRTLRGSVSQEIQKVISSWGLRSAFNVNKSDGTITCRNGRQVIFAGLDDVEKLKSITPAVGVLTDVWIEEATEAQQASVKQLLKRQRGGSSDVPKRLHMTFNPILKQHWLYSTYFAPARWADDQTEYNSPELSILKTWYIHNRFLTPEDIRDLEAETDHYYRDVYTFGNWGVLGNVIFRNWESRDLSGMRDQFTNPRNGLDFGYSSDPAALVLTHYDTKGKTIYIYDELYERGLTNDLLAAEIRKRAPKAYIVVDSAEPKSAQELRGYGVSVGEAKKGKDSVLHGVQWLQQQRIIVDVNCVNTIAELQQYKWREDKNGEPVSPPQPLDRNNHALDALRYAYEQDMSSTWWMS